MRQHAHEINADDPRQFERFLETVLGREISDFQDDELIGLFSLFQHASDRLLSEIGERRLIETHMGHPVIPMGYPDGVEPAPTVLNGGQDVGGHEWSGRAQ